MVKMIRLATSTAILFLPCQFNSGKMIAARLKVLYNIVVGLSAAFTIHSRDVNDERHKCCP